MDTGEHWYYAGPLNTSTRQHTLSAPLDRARGNLRNDRMTLRSCSSSCPLIGLDSGTDILRISTSLSCFSLILPSCVGNRALHSTRNAKPLFTERIPCNCLASPPNSSNWPSLIWYPKITFQPHLGFQCNILDSHLDFGHCSQETLIGKKCFDVAPVKIHRKTLQSSEK